MPQPVRGEQSPAKDPKTRNRMAWQSSPNKQRPATRASGRQDDGDELLQENGDTGEYDVSNNRESLDIRESPANVPSFWGNPPGLPKPPSTTTSSQRSVSPTKAGDFRLTDIKLKYVDGGTVPANGKGLWDDMTRIGFGISVLPSVIKEKAMKAPGLNPIHPDQHFDPTAGAGPEHEELWTKAEQIHEAALESRNEQLSEAAWNDEVHSTILNVALCRERKLTGIWYRNVTTARIEDKSLLDKALQSKMVDYCLIVDPDEQLDEQIETMMSARGLTSISHSDAEYLRFKIIGVSIEVKRALIGENEAEIQIATWVKAHYAKLRQLAPGMRTVPVLPLVCHAVDRIVRTLLAGSGRISVRIILSTACLHTRTHVEVYARADGLPYTGHHPSRSGL